MSLLLPVQLGDAGAEVVGWADKHLASGDVKTAKSLYQSAAREGYSPAVRKLRELTASQIKVGEQPSDLDVVSPLRSGAEKGGGVALGVLASRQPCSGSPRGRISSRSLSDPVRT